MLKQIKLVEDWKLICWSLLTSRVSGSNGGFGCGPPGFFSTLTCSVTALHNLSQAWSESQEGGRGGGEREQERGTWGLIAAWWEDQTQCHTGKKKIHSILHVQSPASQHLLPPSAPLRRVKPPLTESGSSVHASSGRCSGSSFDGLLKSHQSSRCHCEAQKQMSA